MTNGPNKAAYIVPSPAPPGVLGGTRCDLALESAHNPMGYGRPLDAMCVCTSVMSGAVDCRTCDPSHYTVRYTGGYTAYLQKIKRSGSSGGRRQSAAFCDPTTQTVPQFTSRPEESRIHNVRRDAATPSRSLLRTRLAPSSSCEI